jgi:REP element-mobilizing transposase RayT
MRQLQLAKTSGWGGRRAGAGRKRRGASRVSHRARPQFARRFPLHVTLRIRRDVPSLRTRRCLHALTRAFYAGGGKFGIRLVHFAVMHDHLHMMMEAEGKESLSAGLHALNVRIARAVNRATGRRRGNVLADHYHARILRTPAEVGHARRYLATNAEKHYGIVGEDAFTPRAPVIPPETWLLRLVPD